MTGDAAPRSGQARAFLTRTLVGEGIEVGPGDHPMPLELPGARARYVDRWSREENQQLFKELPDGGFTQPDAQVDLNVDKLSHLPDGSQDFVIASHVLEHLVEPLGQLRDWYRVLRPGGVLLLLLPDRRRTFDRDRQPTTLAHLVDELERGVTELDDAHLEEFVAHVPEDWGPDAPPKDQAERFERHRRRSIHVHCWDQHEFAEVLHHCVAELGMAWELVDLLAVEDVEDSIEFGITLRRGVVPLPAATAARRFQLVWSELMARSQDRAQLATTLEAERARSAALELEVHRGRAELEAAQQVLRRQERVLGPLRRTGLLTAAARLEARIGRPRTRGG